MSEFEHTPLYGRSAEVPDYSHLPPPPKSEAELQAEERALVEDVLDEAFDRLELSDDFVELEQRLGSRYVFSQNYPLASNRYINSHGDRYAHIPGAIQLGARTVDCEANRQMTGTNVLGVKGKVLFYRTRQAADDELIAQPRGWREKPELYHEAGFFAFALAIRDVQSGQVIPTVAFGDIDHTRWQSEGFRLQAIDIINNAPTIEMMRPNEGFGDAYNEVEQQLFGQRLAGVFKPRTLHGVFLQNHQRFVDTVAEQYVVIQQLRDAMQQFINDHARPEQLLDGDQSFTPFDPTGLVDPSVLSVGLGKKQRGMIRDWERLQLEGEQSELPFVHAVAEAQAEGLFSLMWYLQRPLGMLLREVPKEELLAKLQSAELTDEEIRTVHACNEKTIAINSRGKTTVSITPTWKKFVDMYPHLYKDLDLDAIAAAEQAKWDISET